MPIIPFPRRPHLKGGDALLAEPRAPLAPTPSPHAIAVASPARVLSVGRMDEDALMREPLDEWPGFAFFHANDYRDVWRLSRAMVFDVVIFHNSLGCFELEESARLVRRRWPSAKIVLVRSGEITLESRLYDWRLRPPIEAETLLSVLSGDTQPIGQRVRPRWRMTPALGN